jgi:hypothetical protein
MNFFQQITSPWEFSKKVNLLYVFCILEGTSMLLYYYEYVITLLHFGVGDFVCTLKLTFSY